MSRRANRRRRARNPNILGGKRPMQILEGAAGVLTGVAFTKWATGLLPANFTSSNAAAAAASVVVAIAGGFLGGMVSPEFGLTVLYGGIAQAGSQALNEFVPSVGAVVSLSGYRANMGDFVPGRFAVPQNPILDANPSFGPALPSGAYPNAYRVSS